MTKAPILTQSHAKRVSAAALSTLKARRDWSNADLGEAMGCGEGTVRNRLDGDSSNNQLTAHELVRLTLADGPAVANALFGEVGFELVPDAHGSAPDALVAASGAARCAAALIERSPDGIDLKEWRELLPLLEDHDRVISAMLRKGRAVLSGGDK